MKFVELLDLANGGYPDGFMANYYRRNGSVKPDEPGDTLALFIVRELRDTYDRRASDEAQLDDAIRVLETARRDLNSVVDALTNAAARQSLKGKHSRRNAARKA